MATLMRAVHCPSALLPDGWATDVRLDLAADGTIARVQPRCTLPRSPDVLVLPGPTVPGMPNLHSHAFQRAIAGCTQRRGPGSDSFWTWREAMYASLDRIGPEELEAIAAALYVELLEGGFTSIAEFHYVHHDTNGTPYTDSAELSWRILEAANTTGIGLTHLPVLYMTGGFDGRPLGPRQARFGSTPGSLLELIERFASRMGPRHNVGLALHSLRAVPPDALQHAVSGLRQLRPGAPIHIHIAEQTAEVDACLATRGTRPVAWLLDHAPVDADWCLIHATHIDPTEATHMQRTGLVAGLCPTTEADLGDGLFPAVSWVQSGGILGVGTDSHVGRSAADELRWLEYGQRLFTRGRNVLHWPGHAHTGAALWRAAAQGGARALGRRAGAIEVGAHADLISLDPSAPGLTGLSGDEVLDAWVFGGDTHLVSTVLVDGAVCVRDGRHVARDPIMQRFRRVLQHLRK